MGDIGIGNFAGVLGPQEYSKAPSSAFRNLGGRFQFHDGPGPVFG
jgi:hypothetical protein